MPRRLYLSRTTRNADRSPVRASFRAGSAAHHDTEQDREQSHERRHLPSQNMNVHRMVWTFPS